jgi:hypothetical protein
MRARSTNTHINPTTTTEATMKHACIIPLILILAFVTCSCSHNPAVFTVGKRTNIGFDPGQMTANVSWTDGLNIVDVPRENSSWELEIDEGMGLQFDPATNTLKGVKKISRKTGVQITGYLVDLAVAAPEAAEAYIKQAAELQTVDGVKLSPHLVTLPLPQSNGTGITKLTLSKLKAQAAADTTITSVPEGLNMSLEDWKLLVEAYKECPECLALTPAEAAALEKATGITYPNK